MRRYRGSKILRETGWFGNARVQGNIGTFSSWLERPSSAKKLAFLAAYRDGNKVVTASQQYVQVARRF